MTKTQSFFRTMLEEKDLDEEIITITHNEIPHIIEVNFLIELMERSSKKEQATIEKTMRLIDFKNGDMMHYLNHLATGYVTQNY